MAATMASGLMRGVFRSKMTSDGGALRISASAASADRANDTCAPIWFAVVRILDVNIKSSKTAKIIPTMIIESQAVGPFFKNGYVVGCEETREAAIIDPGDEVAGRLAVGGGAPLHVRHTAPP